VYNIKIGLRQEVQDMGFFDAYEPNAVVETTSFSNVTVTGTTYSRLNELEKYAVNSTYENKYISNGSTVSDGVDYNASVRNNCYVYYINGMEYIDIISNESVVCTTYSFIAQGTNSPDFISAPIFKNPDKEKIVSNPKIDDDVFIVRQEVSAFDKNYRLEFVRNLLDLETYAGGKYFNIIQNS
jgi:hypothetical protein